MLLVMDIGNTSIAFGIFSASRLMRHWRLETRKAAAKMLGRILKKHLRGHEIEGACVSSVVPNLNRLVSDTLKKFVRGKILFVSAKNSGIKIVNYNRNQIGMDRLVNAVAAYEKYKRPLIVVDFGTATTFDYVTTKGHYGGGVIAPGVELSRWALNLKTAKLPYVDVKKPARVIGRKTEESIQSGLFHGYVGLIDHIVDSIKKESKNRAYVISTGGLAPLIAPAAKTIKKIEPALTLEGLKIIWEKNKKNC